MYNKRIGRQEPTVCIIQPYKDSDAEIAIKLYELSGRHVLPWQGNQIYDILAIDENDLWVHQKYGYAVPRRNGKGEVILIRELYGLVKGEKILHTAHLQSTSHSAFERLERLLKDIGLKKDEDYTSIKAKGQEEITLINGGTIHFRTRTATGALGEGFDLVVIDEAQEYRIEHETALKYVVTDSGNPQTIFTGTPPTAVSSGTVFKDFRDDVLSGRKHDGVGWAEWSVEEMSDPEDRDLWYETNPSLGLTLSERNVASELGSGEDAKIDFNIQRLGLWIRYSQQSIIGKIAWSETNTETLPKLSGKMCVGVKYSKDAMSVVVAVSCKTKDGKIFTEVFGRKSTRDGNKWIIDFLNATKNNTIKVVIDGKSGQSILAEEMKKNRLKSPHLPTVGEIIEANQTMEDGIFQKTLVHMEQPSLTEAITNCEHRAIGSGGGFGYKTIEKDRDATLIEAFALAHWATGKFKPVKQKML